MGMGFGGRYRFEVSSGESIDLNDLSLLDIFPFTKGSNVFDERQILTAHSGGVEVRRFDIRIIIIAIACNSADFV